jgi:hypothetical protein
MLFAQRRGMGRGQGNGMGQGPNSLNNLTPEQRFMNHTKIKYDMIKKRLTKKNANKVLPIIKKYDKKIFTLMKPHMEKVQKLRNSEYANYKERLALQEEGLELRIKVLKLKKQELKELKSTGLSNEILVRILRREMRQNVFGRNRGNFFKGKRGRRGMQGRRGMMNQGF